MEKEKVKLTNSELRDITMGDSLEYRVMTREYQSFDHGDIVWRCIVKRDCDNKYFAFEYGESYSDGFHFSDFGYDDTLTEVFQKEVVHFIYVNEI